VTLDVCANEFPYTFEGHVFTQAGSIIDTVGATAGCSSVRSSTGNELPLRTTTVTLEVCANEFPYTFEGHVFTQAGSIIDTVSATAGCDTIRSITVNELPLLTTTVTLDVCANEFPYTFEGHVFTQAGSIIDTVGATTGC